MDVKKYIETSWITPADVIASESKIVIILNDGEEAEVKTSTGKTFKSPKFKVEFDKTQKEWTPNSYTIKKLAKMFNTTDTKEWIGKPIKLTTMLMQGGKEGIVPV